MDPKVDTSSSWGLETRLNNKDGKAWLRVLQIKHRIDITRVHLEHSIKQMNQNIIFHYARSIYISIRLFIL